MPISTRAARFISSFSGIVTFKKAGELPDLEQENLRLRRDLRRTEEERDILKKALAIFSDRPR